jgi:hypothetical protein
VGLILKILVAQCVTRHKNQWEFFLIIFSHDIQLIPARYLLDT